MKCPACGQKVGKWDVTCTKCGYDLSKLSDGGTVSHRHTGSNTSRVFKVITIVFVVITIIFGIISGVVLQNAGSAFMAWAAGAAVCIAFWGISKHFENQEELIDMQNISNSYLAAINEKLSK